VAKLLAARRQSGSELSQIVGPFGVSETRPRAFVEGLAGRGHGAVHIRTAGLGHLEDHLLGHGETISIFPPEEGVTHARR